MPAAEELQKRREFYERVAELRSRQERSGAFLTTEDTIREDRDR
jgi:hypothetical protein